MIKKDAANLKVNLNVNIFYLLSYEMLNLINQKINPKKLYLIQLLFIQKNGSSVYLVELGQLKIVAQNVPTERTAIFVYFLPSKCSDGTKK